MRSMQARNTRAGLRQTRTGPVRLLRLTNVVVTGSRRARLSVLDGTFRGSVGHPEHDVGHPQQTQMHCTGAPSDIPQMRHHLRVTGQSFPPGPPPGISLVAEGPLDDGVANRHQ
jgi:hypothetical protein